MDEGLNFGKFVDERDGKEYKTVKIGGQTWLAENLNYAGTNGDIGKCYDNDPANGEKYGRLYTWDEAIKISPAGWHLPTGAEWTQLTDFVGGAAIAGRKLKSTSGWNDYKEVLGNGTDEYGFSALPAGFGYSDGSFDTAGSFGRWWSASEVGASGASYRRMDYFHEDARWLIYSKNGLLSVRCVAD